MTSVTSLTSDITHHSHLICCGRISCSYFAPGAIFCHGVSLFVAGAAFGDVAVSLFLAGAAFGDVGASLFVAGSIWWNLGRYPERKMF